LYISKKNIAIIIIVVLVIAVGNGVLIIRYIQNNRTEMAEFHEPETPSSAPSPSIAPSSVPIQKKSAAFEAVAAMGVGWNLGNSLDCIDNRKRGILSELKDITPEEFYETYWGNPVTTKAMIDTVAQAGFGAVRIPVTYADHMDEQFVIRAEWLNRVEEVVNYVLDNSLYCVINLHHDTGHGSWPWLKADPDNLAALERRLNDVWTQIAGHFIGYGDKLIFESFNEILDTQDRWSGTDTSAYYIVNRLNQTFVDAVRATGGANTRRLLIVKPYAASADAEALDAFIIPDDTAEGKLIFAAHYYGPMLFTWRQESVNWATVYDDWRPDRDGQPVEDFIDRLNESFISKGIPVIVGEFGAKNKNNTAARVNYAAHYVSAAKKYGIACFWWDDGGQFDNADEVNSHALLDRINNRWYFPQIAEALVKAAR